MAHGLHSVFTQVEGRDPSHEGSASPAPPARMQCGTDGRRQARLTFPGRWSAGVSMHSRNIPRIIFITSPQSAFIEAITLSCECRRLESLAAATRCGILLHRASSSKTYIFSRVWAPSDAAQQPRPTRVQSPPPIVARVTKDHDSDSSSRPIDATPNRRLQSGGRHRQQIVGYDLRFATIAHRLIDDASALDDPRKKQSDYQPIPDPK